jgi:hypothetical protein
MAVLATYSDVQDVMQDTSIDSTYITNVLTTVDLVLTKVYENYAGVISDALLEEIQKYYAAHVIASTTKRMASKEKLGEANVEYIGSFGKGLDLTPYGQMVKMIDVSGLIARSGKIAASIYAIKS